MNSIRICRFCGAFTLRTFCLLISQFRVNQLGPRIREASRDNLQKLNSLDELGKGNIRAVCEVQMQDGWGRLGRHRYNRILIELR